MRIASEHDGIPLRRFALGLTVLAGALAAVLAAGDAAPAADLQAQLSERQAELQEVEADAEVLTTEISAYSERINTLEAEVATLRTQEAAVQAELDAKEAELDRAEAELQAEKEHLELLRAHLKRAMVVLADRLVAIYKSGTPDVTSVLLQADGFSDLVEQSEYLSVIENQDSAIVDRVRTLRDQTRETVERLREVRNQIRAARDAIAARKAELTETRAAIEGRQAELIAVRGARAASLEGLEAREAELEGDISDISAQIEEQLAQTSSAPLPAGPPVSGQSSAGLIWPVSGPVTSGFGMRWGRMHEGIDIAVPAGTPIVAAASGTVILAGYTGGYGNYTCIDHGGGLSTCYAHQSSYATSTGAGVSQGQVIGYVGCTGSCFGDHLHFEVRINGAATDPLGYL